MIKQFNGASAEYNSERFEPVPVGSYVARITGARLETDKQGAELLAVAVDIAEGDYAGYYKKRFDADRKTDPSAKFKGVVRYYIPTGDGSERDGWNVNKFNRLLGAVTASNAGFVWNWNEQSLIGKAVGLVYRPREWEFNGKSGMTTEIGMLCSVDDARKGKITLKPRMLNKTATPAASAAFKETVEELPF